MAESLSSSVSRVFISYAHKDGMDFTRRLAYALSFYADTFFDIHLQSGEYPIQLYQEIELRSHFVFVMTPYSLASEWCRKELALAQEKHNDNIALAKIFPQCDDAELESKYTYGDFIEEFERGFRRLTEMIVGGAYSSWEAYGIGSDEELISRLRGGFLPSVIAKEIAEYVLLEQLWPPIENYAASREIHHFRGFPRTPFGILRQSAILRKQFVMYRDSLGVHYADQAQKIAEIYANDLYPLRDSDSKSVGATADGILNSVRKVLRENAIGLRDANKLAFITYNYFDFCVAEKLRELINIHARRSRYLY